jgi:tRNA 5-methylaminomethyl-2-thiouridine biosynthesis bifunctional protein
LKTAPIRPLRIAFGAGPEDAPHALDFGEDFPTAAAGLQRARRVFLEGTGLPARWAGRAHFVVLETGFGLGHNFLATWQAWRDDPARCARLCVVAIASHPPTATDLARAHARSPLPDLAAALARAWPPLTPNLHALDFDGGAVQLLLGLGEVTLLLPALQLQADAIHLDGFAPARDPAMWQLRVLKALGRQSAAGARLATGYTAPELQAGLTSAGFAVQPAADAGSPRTGTVAHWAPRHMPRSGAPPRPARTQPPQTAVVVGAGIAGAAAAQALARLGVAVTVLDRRSTPAQEASGNPAGLVHGTVNGDDGTYARLFRAAALQAARSYREAMAHDPQMGALDGLLRLSLDGGGLTALQATVDRLGLPPDWVQALGPAAASARAALPLPAPAWLYPAGGWINPARWVRHVLAQDGVRFQGDASAQRISFEDGLWTVWDAASQALAKAPVLVLACTASTPRLLQPWCAAPWPLDATRGQVTRCEAGAGGTALRCAVAGDGYAIPLPDGSLLCGATREAATLAEMLGAPDIRTQITPAAHRHNLKRLQRLTGLQAPLDAAALQGRAGWRLHADDRLPIAGAVPLRDLPPGQRRDQARLLPRAEGLFVLTALGARGLTLAPLLGRLVAAQALGTPWPLEQDLADAVDPARWRVRAARQDQAGA